MRKGGGSYGKGEVNTAKRVHIFCILFNLLCIFKSNMHILYILHIFHLTILFINSYHFFTGFYLSDNDEDMPEDPTATANDEQLPDSPVHQHEIGHPSAFDFHGSMRRLGGNPTSMFSVVDQVDDMLPAGPIVVHSERAGGGARYVIFCI
jgi:hypothetical protein